jgi:dTDP-4-amino-4,6-dideoxygalactose transaminase
MAVLRAKLPCLRVWTDERQRLAQRYEQALALSEVELQQVQPWAEHARHLFVLLRPDRDRLIQTLQEAGVGAGVHYPLACHQQPALARRFRSVGGLEVTERVAANCLSLPLYAELGDGGVDQVAETLGSLLLAAAA